MVKQPEPIQHLNENLGNADRRNLHFLETKCLRTFTPTQAVLQKSAGIFHWTPDGKKLFDFTSGVLVSNLGHNPIGWTERFLELMCWNHIPKSSPSFGDDFGTTGFQSFQATPLTAYNAITPVEVRASEMVKEICAFRPGGKRLERVIWAASGSEAVVKALWAGMAFQPEKDLILASRFGFHGKKGLAGAVTGSEKDKERDPRVHFFSFPREECDDISKRDSRFIEAPYQEELEYHWQKTGGKIGTLITEPYLGGGGSYHPPAKYLQMVQKFCRDKGITFILDEVQSNFGRTGKMFAFETYGLEPDMVVLGKGLGNGIPVAAVVGRADLLESLDYGEGSDTWSANPVASASVVATLEEFSRTDVLGQMKASSEIIEQGLVALQNQLPFVAHVRGERGGMVWGLEMADHGGRTANEWANQFVLECYLGTGEEGIHLLGPLAQKVVRISPPLVISEKMAHRSMDLMHQVARRMGQESC